MPFATLFLVAVAALFAPAPASAGKASDPAATPAPAPAVSTPVPAQPPSTLPPPAERDGARVLGRLGLGTFARIPFDLGGDLPALEVDSVGLRYWFSGDGPWVARAWGIDVGLSFAYRREELGGAAGADSSSTAFGFHAGMPFVLAQLPHANFAVVPEVDVVWLRGEIGEADLSGMALAAGARAGFELFFGFIGISDLSLEASIGFGYSHVRTTLGEGAAEVERSTTFAGVRKLDDPWDIFRSSVAARYYF